MVSLKTVSLVAAVLMPTTVHLFSEEKGALDRIWLSGAEIGEGWLLEKLGGGSQAGAPYYTKEGLAANPVFVMFTPHQSDKVAKQKLIALAESPNSREYMKKVSENPLSYEQKVGKHRKRYVVIGHLWLTVDQSGSDDTREEVITAYLKRFGSEKREEVTELD